jgi:hypothetical protein
VPLRATHLCNVVSLISGVHSIQQIPAYRSNHLEGPAYDNGADTPERHQLLHKGSELGVSARPGVKRQRQEDDLQIARGLVEAYVEQVVVAGLDADNLASGLTAPDAVQRAKIYKHSQATGNNGLIISSLAHSRSIRAAACHVTIQTADGLRVCCIDRFLRVVPHAAGASSRPPTRLAIVRIYRERHPVRHFCWNVIG